MISEQDLTNLAISLLCSLIQCFAMYFSTSVFFLCPFFNPCALSVSFFNPCVLFQPLCPFCALFQPLCPFSTLTYLSLTGLGEGEEGALVGVLEAYISGQGSSGGVGEGPSPATTTTTTATPSNTSEGSAPLPPPSLSESVR